MSNKYNHSNKFNNFFNRYILGLYLIVSLLYLFLTPSLTAEPRFYITSAFFAMTNFVFLILSLPFYQIYEDEERLAKASKKEKILRNILLRGMGVVLFSMTFVFVTYPIAKDLPSVINKAYPEIEGYVTSVEVDRASKGRLVGTDITIEDKTVKFFNRDFTKRNLENIFCGMSYTEHSLVGMTLYCYFPKE